VAFALTAYIAWGFVPVYFKTVIHVPSLELLAHRIIWSLALLLCYMLPRGRAAGVIAALRQPRTRLYLIGSTLLIAFNWYLFIWAVAQAQVLQASLGYFINPLVNVLLAVIFLGERLRRPQLGSVLLAGAGVLYLSVSYGEIPLLALLLAFSFGFYGLLRKIVAADSSTGLTAETALLSPLAVGYLVYLAGQGRLVFLRDGAGSDLLLMASGPVTALPLLWFAAAARRLRFATVGILQYITPTLHFLLAVVAYREPFTTPHLVCFGCIWTALVIYSVDSWRESRSPAAGRS
jgi:chloramphenicol-sensitive protein RarD